MKENSDNAAELIARPVAVYGAACKQVKALYREAFPAKERFPVTVLLLGAWKPEIEFTAFYDPARDGRLRGMAYTIEAGSYLYILYLAVVADARGRGYGTRILEFLKQQYPSATFMLEIEPLDKRAANYDQRVARLAFYERNGFARVGYDMVEGTIRYTMLATGVFDADEFSRAVRKLSHGLYRFKIVPAENHK